MTTNRHQVKEYFIKKVVEADRERQGMAMLSKLVLPCMPHTLGECYDANFTAFGMHNPPTDLRIDFYKVPGPTDKAYGTITKAVEGLVKGGWNITKSAGPELLGSTRLQVKLEAELEVDNPHTMMDSVRGIIGRKPFPTRMVKLEIRFENLSPTDSCRLEKREVWIEEIPVVEGHMGTKNVLVCDSPDDEDDGEDEGK